MTQPTSDLTINQPYTTQSDLPEPLGSVISQMISDQHQPASGGYAILETQRTSSELKRDYWVATLGSWALALGTVAFSYFVGTTNSWVSAAMVFAIFGILTLVSFWLWVGKRGQLVKDRYWEMGIATPDTLIMRDIGTFRVVSLADFTHTRVDVQTVNGAVADIALVLCNPERELRWIGITAFPEEGVVAFSDQLNVWMNRRPPAI